MHILFYCFEYPPQCAGVGAYMQNMAQGLVAAGHQATVVTCHVAGLPEICEEEGVIVHRCYDYREIRSKFITEKVLHIASELNVDWIEGADHMGECAPLLSNNKRPPVVVKVHNCNAIKVVREALILYPWQRIMLWLAIFKTFNQFFAERKSITKADVLIAPSTKIIEALRRQKITLPGKVFNIANPINAFIKSPSLHVVQEKKILFAGRLCFGKGVHLIPELMKFLRGSGVVLEIAGADSYARGIGSVKSWLQDKLSNDAEQVHFLGRIPRDEMARVIQNTRLVIVPSRWDNFPTVILEAMKFSKPVVASIHGGMSEMLEGTGCPVCDLDGDDFFETVAQLVRSKSTSELLGRNMRNKLLTSYVPEIIVPEYINSISKVINSIF
jgi:glycosyltransferase involved in cell wall biosynthesis